MKKGGAAVANGTDRTNEKPERALSSADDSPRAILIDRMLNAADWARKLGLDPLELMQEAVAELDADAMIVVNKITEVKQ